jgi:hypothetical protein
MSYTNNTAAIVGGSGITIVPSIGIGAKLITISASGTQTVAIRNAIVTPVVLTSADAVVSVQVPGGVAVAVTLPAGILGQQFTIKDGLGLATPLLPITITPAAGTIDGALGAIIDAAYGSLTLVYNGTQWLII